jgi:Leucine-rich repeat (LRR) protein
VKSIITVLFCLCVPLMGADDRVSKLEARILQLERRIQELEALLSRSETKPIHPNTKLGKTFTNTLGMKFVAVPGADVQFCIWETRVKDYLAYYKANKGVDASFITFNFRLQKTDDTHPVVRVGWRDAEAFCAWLTKKKLAAGKIKAGQFYRLPTDAEWSVAVGLGKDEEPGGRIGLGGSLKNIWPWGPRPPGKWLLVVENLVVWPWGKEWPPPMGAGNYDSIRISKERGPPPALARLLLEGTNKRGAGGKRVDNFEFTSPVGSFAANKHGIHDLGGNVWEWCGVGDPDAEFLKWDPRIRAHLVRGGSWNEGLSQWLLSSYRDTPLGGSSNDVGFRCVLTNGSEDKTPPAAGSIVEQAIRKELKKPTGELTKADLEKVTHLNLSYNKLTKLPKELEKLTQLTSLDLGVNKLTELPNGLEKLTQLKNLYLHDNKLTSVKELEKLTQLTRLYLNDNKLAELPMGLEKLTQLTSLDLGVNQLTDVKGLEKLNQLKYLLLWHNKLTDVTGLEKLTQLKYLGLDGNPDLTKAQIDELQKALPKCKISSNPTK